MKKLFILLLTVSSLFSMAPRMLLRSSTSTAKKMLLRSFEREEQAIQQKLDNCEEYMERNKLAQRYANMPGLSDEERRDKVAKLLYVVEKREPISVEVTYLDLAKVPNFERVCPVSFTVRKEEWGHFGGRFQVILRPLPEVLAEHAACIETRKKFLRALQNEVNEFAAEARK